MSSTGPVPSLPGAPPSGPVPPLVRHLPARTARADEHDADAVLDGFNAYAAAIGLELYPAQEEAIFELLVGNHVILNTPTGSGKSLVATPPTSPHSRKASAASTPLRSRRSSARSSSPSAATSAPTASG